MSQDDPQMKTQEERPTSEAKLQVRPLVVKGGMDCPKFYANVASVLSTPFDVQIIFGEVAEVTEERAVGKAEVRIVMSPEHAGLLLEALALRLKSYAEQYGKLRGTPMTVGPTMQLRGELNEG
jgi:hypothetical protein